MKDLKNITEEEVRIICELYNEPFIDFHIYNKSFSYLPIISISTTSTFQGTEGPCAPSIYDSTISIFLDGRVKLTRNNGGWNGIKEEDISPLLVIDYLRSRGYEFKYEIPKKLDRRIKLSRFL